MTQKCDICSKEFTVEGQEILFNLNRILTSPGYWYYVISNDSRRISPDSFDEYLERLLQERGAFQVCNSCTSILEDDLDFSRRLGVYDHLNSTSDGTVDKKSIGIVFRSVWKHQKGGNSVSVTSTVDSLDDGEGIVHSGNETSTQPQAGSSVRAGSVSPTREAIATGSPSASVVKPDTTQNDGIWKNILTDLIESMESRIESLSTRVSENTNLIETTNSIHEETTRRFKELETDNRNYKAQLDEITSRIEKMVTDTQELRGQNSVKGSSKGGSSNSELHKRIEKIENQVKGFSKQESTRLAKTSPYFFMLSLLMLIFSVYLSLSGNRPAASESETTIQDSTTMRADSSLNSPTGGSMANPAANPQKGPLPEQTPPVRDEAVNINLATVPGVIGLEAGSASAQLSAQGLNPVIVYVTFGEQYIGKVIKQNPGGGSRVNKGTNVILQIGE